MKRKLNRLLALLLSVLMVSSVFTDLIPPAQAAPAAPAAVTTTGVQDQFRDPDNGRPNLFVDFLGDNNNYPAEGSAPVGLNSLPIPAAYDQSVVTNATGPSNKWSLYTPADCSVNGTIFWVGLGVDRTEVFQLLEGNKGLTSLEAGFYYDSTILEPYVNPAYASDGDGGYLRTITDANINNTAYPGNTQWSSAYTVLRAERALAVKDTCPSTAAIVDPADAAKYVCQVCGAGVAASSVTDNGDGTFSMPACGQVVRVEPDMVTQEELADPSVDQILTNGVSSAAGQSNWKLTYVSLELKDITAAATRRLQGEYKGVDRDAEGNPTADAPAAASGDEYKTAGDSTSGYDYQYLLLIPFKLKKYGSPDWTCLRLARDATHLSMGAGTWGVDPYGAWERVTTRNPAVDAVAATSSTSAVEGHSSRDLKLLTNFTGDLNLFKAGKAEEVEYNALLKIINGGGSANTAKLMVDGDPAVWPVWADTNGDYIRGLQSGLGMKLNVHAESGYKATVTVTYEQLASGGGLETISHQYAYVSDGSGSDGAGTYTFVMPEFKPVGTVTVTVVFQYVSGDKFRVFLTELPQPQDAAHAAGNEATLRTNLDSAWASTADTNTVSSYSTLVAHPNASHSTITNHPDTTPMAYGGKGKNVQVEVKTHADYQAVVRVYSFRAADFLSNNLTITVPTGTVPTPDSNKTIPDPTNPGSTIDNPHYGEIVLPHGGTVGFQLDTTDMDIEIVYEKAPTRQATLEVYNPDGAANMALNTAQLVYDVYDALNSPSKAYSGVVYQDDAVANVTARHRQVKNPGKKLPWVSASQAALSGSLGGDTGRAGKPWNPNDPSVALDPVTGKNTVMAILGSAGTEADFKDKLTGLDLATAQVTAAGKSPENAAGTTGMTGLRGDLYGAPFADKKTPETAADAADYASLAGLETVLWELRTRIEGDATPTTGLQALYKKTVQKSATDTTTAYTYYDLSAAQVQAYLLEIYQAQVIARNNDALHLSAYQRYLTARGEYDALSGQSAYSGMAAPSAPAAPAEMKVTNGVRTYQGEDYQTDYLAKYKTYIDAYDAYVVALKANGAVAGGPDAPGVGTNAAAACPATAPSVKTVALLPDSDGDSDLTNDAQSVVQNWAWKTAALPAGTDDHTIKTREGRTVWVVMEADSAYEVDKVELFTRNNDTDKTAGTQITAPAAQIPVRATQYQNVWSFTMPQRDCVVRVTYKLRGTRNLNITVKGANGLSDNTMDLSAYTADPGKTVPKRQEVTNRGYTGAALPSGGSYDATNDVYKPDPVKSILSGSVVTMTIQVATGYAPKVEALNHDDSTNISVSSRPADNPKDGTVYTFTVSAARTADIDLTVTYTTDVPKNKAEIRGITEDAASDARNSAAWLVADGVSTSHVNIRTDVPQGTHLVGDINVAPGYYIDSVTASGPSGIYTYTLDGNGYNGGYGTYITGSAVPLNLFVDMPAEDLLVEVVFKKGLPPVEPTNTLTLIVKDKDNDPDPAKAAPNWAQATVYEDNTAASVVTTLPTRAATAAATDYLGRNKNYGNGVLTDRKSVAAGKWVKVDFSASVTRKADGTVDPEKSYYVSSVSVGPSNLGIAMVWESTTCVSFYMPAGSTGVTVEFSKYPDDGVLPAYGLVVRETYTDLNATPVPTTQAEYDANYVTNANSGTIQGWSSAAGHNLFPYKLATGEFNPEDVPPTTVANARGAATAGEEVTMTFQVDEASWYYQSVILISNGAATRLTGKVTDVTPTGATGSVKTYQVKFHMPSGPAEFVVHYRRGPKPTIPDYAFTLTLDDDDNAEDPTTHKWDENNVSASFADPTGASTHTTLEVGHNKSAMTAAQHIHAGDTVTLKPTVAAGYALDYMIVNPAGLRIHPVYQADGTATFTMPTQGVAVLARVVKGSPQQYTANLILRVDGGLPNGVTMAQVGQGTFTTPTAGTLNSYPKNAIFSTTQTPGTSIGYDLYAFDGWYIDRVTIDPPVGATGTLSGSFGYQDGSFVMPAANVNVNVWFKRGWPDEVPYDVTLRVFDASLDPSKTPTAADNNYANFHDPMAGHALTAQEKKEVFGGQTNTVNANTYPLDRDTVRVDIHPQSGYYADATSISVLDSMGAAVAWWYVPGGIAYTQPPRAVTVTVTFKEDKGDRDKYQATLHLVNYQAGDTSPDKDIRNDSALMTTQAAQAHSSPAATPTAPVTALADSDLDQIIDLYGGDALDLSVLPGAGRHVTAVYAVDAQGAILPIYDGEAPAQYVPGHPGTAADSTTTPPTPAAAGTAVKGAFAMPERNVDVYVKFADGTVKTTDQPVKLMVSGPSDSGDAEAEIDEPGVTPDQTMTVAAPGMDTRFTQVGNTVTVTFRPADHSADTPTPGKKYDIVKLEVYDGEGNPVPYDWITMLQDPATEDLTSTNTWSGVAPAPGITHPSWKPNPDKQITLQVPSAGGVTVHVTYGEVSADPFKVQVVVNDSAYADAPTPSQNNAWLGAMDAAVKAKLRTARPGEWVDLSVTVHPGYRIEYIKVIPQSFGIAPDLPLGDLYSQSTGFYMPSSDVTVYVKFIDDGIPEKNATLVVTGRPTGNADNYATIVSPRNNPANPTHVTVGHDPESVTARPTIDWVTVDYYWDTLTSSVASITVKAAGVDVPFTQAIDPANGHGTITFPMAKDNVTVTVTYRDNPAPVGYDVVLHVIDKDAAGGNPILGDYNGDTTMDNYGRLVYAGNPAINAGPADTGEIGPDTDYIAAGSPTLRTYESVKTIQVPAGQTVDLTACSSLSDTGGPVYIESAYVLYTDGGQMFNMNLTPDDPGPGFSGSKTGRFTVHPCRNDVYVTLTREQPTQTEYSAVLMLKSPREDTSSEAGIHADQNASSWQTADMARRDKVRANDPGDTHAYVTATQGEKITINVEPASGYVIDYILVTPLGFPLESDPAYSFTRTGNTYTFDMPHCNVAVTVYLKRGSAQEHTVNLHFRQDTGSEQIADYAKLTWTPAGEASRSIWADMDVTHAPAGSTEVWDKDSSMTVLTGSEVTLDVTLDSPDVILSAFVLRKSGGIETLTPVYPAGRAVAEGLEGLGESASATDNTKADATATFQMPADDADVYVVVTNAPPTDPWHTVVLVASDHSPTGNNKGLSEADIWNDKTPTAKKTAKSTGNDGCVWLAVPEGDAFGIEAKPGSGYSYDTKNPAHVRCVGTTAYDKNLTPTSYPNPITFHEAMDAASGMLNKAVYVNFTGGDLELTVEIEDPDNPGDGTVENRISVDPSGTTPDTLDLASNSLAGAYQIMSGVGGGDKVAITATPHGGYAAYAQLFDNDNQMTFIPLTDSDNDGTFDGAFTMPNSNARVVVTFYVAYTGTLTLVNRIPGDTTGQATMTEDDQDRSVTVHSLTASKSITGLPNGTLLSAHVDAAGVANPKVTALATANGSTTFLSAIPAAVTGDPDHYDHTIDRADGEITLILDDPAAHPDTYVAAVQTVDRPDGVADPTIGDTTSPTTQRTGSIWTTADKDDNVKVTLDVPKGWRAVVTAVTVPASGAGTAVDLTDSADHTAGTPAASVTVPAVAGGHPVSLKMPAANVLVTVTYEKVEFTLTLNIVDTSGLANATVVTPDSSGVLSGGPTLTAHGATMTVQGGISVDLSATPDAAAHIAGLYYQTADGAATWLVNSPLAAGAAYTPASPAFTMPRSDTVVTVVYDKERPAPEEPYYIASVEVVDPDHAPGNKAVSIVNRNRTTLKDGTALPKVQPVWVAGYRDDGVTVSYQVQHGYHVVVTARRADNGTDLPVVVLASSANGTATIKMPSANAIITLKYVKGDPTPTTAEVALQLLAHGAKKGNTAATTGGTLSGLTTNGTTATHPPRDPAYTDATDPVETVKSSAQTGDDLRTLANWASGYHVSRMTVAVRKATTADGVTTYSETPEVDLLISRYGSAATTRCPMPPVGTDEVAVIRVYYGYIFEATLHVVGAAGADKTEATDNRTATGGMTVTSTGTSPITATGDKLIDMGGGEQVQTLAVPDTTQPSPNHRLVGVVWESDLTGGRPTTPDATVSDQYNFTMPADNVDFYAVYEEEPDDPKDRSYIAKVAFDPDSAHLGDKDNKVTISNSSNSSALHGNYWTAAKGGDTITINVKAAKGYQAQVITTKTDDQSAGVLNALPQIIDDSGTLRNVLTTDSLQYYISRTQFIYNLPTGKDATFTMPALTDATVTIKFTKGYKLTMDLDDRTMLPPAGSTTTNMTESGVTDKTTTSKAYGLITNKTENTAGGQTPTSSAAAADDVAVNVGSGSKYATLRLDRGGSANNTVKMYATAVPGSVITGNNSKITGLKNGDQITLDIFVAPGYKCVVSAYRDEDKVNLLDPTTITSSSGTRTFHVSTQLYSQVIARVTFSKVSTYSLASLSAVSPTSSAGTENTLHDLPGDLRVSTDVIVDGSLSGVEVTHFQTTASTGTRAVSVTAGDPDNFQFIMGYEDTEGVTLLKNTADPDNLLAKVELKGESDVAGNTATPIEDETDRRGVNADGTTTTPAVNKTITGAIWTTTDGKHVIDLDITVAKGYIAKIKVRRDDSYVGHENDASKWVYLPAANYQFKSDADGTNFTPMSPINSAGTEVQLGFKPGSAAARFPQSISDPQHFRFVMPETRAASGTAGSAGYDPGDKETDVTVVVEFVFAGTIPRPLDPRNDVDKTPEFLEEGFIYGDNRGDYAVIEVSTLEQDEKLFDTDNYDAVPTTAGGTKDANKKIKKFHFHLYDAATDTYTELYEGTDVVLEPYDEDDAATYTKGNPYNLEKGMYHGSETWHDTSAAPTTRDFVGSRFKLYPAEPDATTGKRSAGAQKLYDMLNNKGSLETYTVPDPADSTKTVTKYRTTLYITAENAVGETSAHTQVWIRPHYTLAVKLVSYGPTHEAEGSLYKLMTEGELNVASGYWTDLNGTVNPTPPAGVTHLTPDQDLFQHYKWDDDHRADVIGTALWEEEAGGKWFQYLNIMSADLLGSYDKTYDPGKPALDNVKSTDPMVYALTVEKAANLTYTRVKLNLNPKDPGNTELAAATLSDYYDAATMTFTISDEVHLIAGDVDDNGKTKWQDYDLLYDYVFRGQGWTALATEPQPPLKADGTVDTAASGYAAYQAAAKEWAISVYNPESMPYRCDLNSDRMLTLEDLNILTSRFNYNRTQEDYLWYAKSGGAGVLPFGLGAGKTNYDALFSLSGGLEGQLLADTYWDEPVDPETTEAPPLEKPIVDEAGNVWPAGTLFPDQADAPRPEDPAQDAWEEDQRAETPLGEEALDRPVALPSLGDDLQEVEVAPPPEDAPLPKADTPEDTPEDEIPAEEPPTA